ncbi:MAG: hypothetical protein A3K83_01090 [Omnitrophica WOR_2 bacterium RBG_13_44_8b]|nr:MAG: hypothetical protein A3K83_01090 [Omnitrophica WOR_2 bacterium RBG_13_44_8b]
MIFLLGLSGIFILILSHESFVNFKFSRLKRKIRNDPLIGEREEDNNYYYKEGSYGVSYKIKEMPSGIKTVEWVFNKRRLTYIEEKALKAKKFISNLFLYGRWMLIFRPPIIFLLISSIIIFYFGLIETQKTRINRLKWVVASASGVDTSQIQYIGDGWLQISGKRKTATDKINEPVRYTFNPLRWFFSSEAGFITRWRGKTFGYVTHPVAFNDKGDVWISKEGTWRHGKLNKGRAVEWDWDRPQGTRRVTGQEFSTEDKKPHFQDK